ncbi:hypothetical protein GCM10011506_40320 [Marivirga lumbricoides]|uniref:DUF4282 domain-containing protein n=1 Tax=Marivirga lumbricoides TaxID=1046115 RepID=A0ABQ1N7U5_9BACT|nr:hypothetical protein GCM10011506_40320 [Marivirga lumbricoides]
MKLNKYKDLPSGLFGKLFWNIFFAYLVLFLIVGLLSLFGIKSVSFNDEPTFGLMGLLSALLIAPLTALSTSFAIWLLMMIGNVVMKMFVK